MKTIKFENDDVGREKWLSYRLGKITGTRLKDVIVKRGTTPKIGFYKLIAERIALPPSRENAMDRGTRLEDEAIKRFEKETGLKVNSDLIMWEREDNPDIAISPDGVIGKTEAVEVKCLASELHVKAYCTQSIPSEYADQVLQYFIVNDKLNVLHFVLYDPRMPKDFLMFMVNREDVQDKVDQYLEYELKILAEVKRIADELTF